MDIALDTELITIDANRWKGYHRVTITGDTIPRGAMVIRV